MLTLARGPTFIDPVGKIRVPFAKRSCPERTPGGIPARGDPS